MKLIHPYNNQKLLDELLSSGKRVGLTEINGTVHEGHAFIFSEVKQLVDIHVVSYAEWNHYSFATFNFNRGDQNENNICHTYKHQPSFSIRESIRPEWERFIDFFCWSPVTDSIKEQTSLWLKEKRKCVDFCKQKGIEYLWPQVLISPIIDIFDGTLDCYVGPKNIIPDLAGRKLFQSDRFWKPDYIWKFYRDEVFQTKSRSSNSVEIGIITKIVRDVIQKKGQLSADDVNLLKGTYVSLQLDVVILDLDTLDRLSATNDNCVISCVSGTKADYLFIKDKELIF